MATETGFFDTDNLDGAGDIAVALGNMVVAWARAEMVLSQAFALICGIDANMALFGYYRIPTFESRVKFIRAMLDEWKTTKHNKTVIAEAIDKLSKLSRTRNDWVHGAWARGRVTKQIVVFDYRSPEDRGRKKEIKAHDINHHVATVRSRTDALDALIPWDDIAP